MLERACDRGLPTPSPPITLVQETGIQRSALVAVACYQPGASLGTVAQRREALVRYAQVVLRMGDLVDGASADRASHPHHLDLVVFEPDLNARDGLLYSRVSPHRGPSLGLVGLPADAKAGFLAAMSHEIRTPMDGVIGMLDVLIQATSNPTQMEMARTIRQSGATLLSIVNEIFDYSRIEAGKLEIVSEEFSPEELVESAMRLLEPVATTQSVALTEFTDPALPRRVWATAAPSGGEKGWSACCMDLASNSARTSWPTCRLPEPGW